MKRIFLIAVILLTSMEVFPQNNSVTISINLPAMQYENLVFSDLIEEFEAAHPDIRVHVIRSESMQPFVVQSAEQAQDLAATADVLYLDSTLLDPDVPLRGAFLDLNPLIITDDSLNSDDFYEAAWQSFQWDNGVWAAPLSFHPILLSYDPMAFDMARLPYPDENWTMTDLAQAAQTLQAGEDAGLRLTEERWVLRSLLGENLLDESTFPATPQLNTPATTELLQTWNALHTDGAISDLGDAPMSVSPYLSELDTRPDRAFTLLPGGQAGIRLNGLAISAGTLYPEQAYEFVKFLTHHPQPLSLGRYALPARQSVDAVLASLEPDVQELITTSIPHIIPFSETRYFDYLIHANRRVTQGMSAQDALQTVEDIALQDRQDILDQQDAPSIVVAPPPAQATIPDGQATLRFGFHAYGAALGMTNETLWDSVIEDFVANDPQVGDVAMETLVNRVDFTENFDCFFTPHGIGALQPNTLLPLEPLMAADADFSRQNFVPGTLRQVTFDGQLYGYPLIVQLEVLNYDPNSFTQAGVPLPTDGWTISDFLTALQAIKPQRGDEPVLGTTRVVATDLQQLIAAFGGLPIDYRTDPPTINFTEAGTIEAIRQVLDLVRAGYIHYIPRSGEYGVPLSDTTAPIMPNSRGMLGSVQQGESSVLYPVGQTYQPVGLGVGALYISRNTAYPEACYRWFSTIVAHPALMDQSMYATYSALNSPAAETAQGADSIALYNAVVERLEHPDTVVIPSPWVGSSSLAASWPEHWLYEAFSAYVFDDANLEQALTDAEINANAYLECTRALPPRDPSQDYNARYEDYRACAVRVDQTLDT